MAARRIHTGIDGVGWKREKRIQDAIIGSNGMNGRNDRLSLSENNNTTSLLGRIYFNKVQSPKVKEKNQTSGRKKRKSSASDQQETHPDGVDRPVSTRWEMIS